MPEPKIWIDGALVEKANATVSVYDHGLLYGDGVFEGMRVYHGKVFELDAHLRRLEDSAKAIRLSIPYTRKELADATKQTVAATGYRDCYVRLLVTRGAGTLGLDPNRCPRPGVIVIAETIQLYPPELYEKGMSVVTSTVTRNLTNALSPRIKSLNYLNNILAKIEAVDAGVPEAIMLNAAGRVAECTADNLFVVRDGVVRTPPVSEGALEGITRDAILRLCVRHDIAAREALLERHDVYSADECFLTGSAAEVIPVTEVDKRPVGDGKVGPVTKRLQALFHELVRSEVG